jgi:hypothetical protein
MSLHHHLRHREREIQQRRISVVQIPLLIKNQIQLYV